MSWFQLDTASVEARVRASGCEPEVPSLGLSMRRGIIGFTVVSVAGFAPWALFGRWFYKNIGEVGLYIVCAALFVGLAGLLMHRLIIGPGSLSRFYKVFAVSFTAYSAGWIGGWVALRGHSGSVVGLLVGTAVMGWMLARAFDAMPMVWQVIGVLFVLNALGYFIGGVVEGAGIQLNGTTLSRSAQVTIAKLLWGVCYGIGFGAGLGVSFYLCQAKIRAILKASGDDLINKQLTSVSRK